MAESNELFFSLYKINVCMNCTTTMYCKKKMTLSIKNSLYDINTVKINDTADKIEVLHP